MEDYRSRSFGYGDGRMEVYDSRPPPPPPPSGFHHGMRCYSDSYATSQQTDQPPKEAKPKKPKGSHGSSSSSSSSKGGWSLSDPEMQRKKRVTSYKVYAVEGKMKGSLRKSFRWIKDRCSQVVYGWW